MITQSVKEIDLPSFRHLPIRSLDEITHNFEQLGLTRNVPVRSLLDATEGFQALGRPLPCLPVQSLTDASRNFEALSG